MTRTPVRSPRLRRSWRAARLRELAAGAAALALLTGCDSETLDPGEELDGRIITLAPHTVAISIAPEREIELGSALRVRVATHAGTTGLGVTSIGASGLLLNSQGRIVTVVPLGLASFEQPALGLIERDFELRPPTHHLDLNRLPNNLRFEVHAFVRSGGGACAAAVASVGQRLPCTELEGNVVAVGERGEPFDLKIHPPHFVALRSSVAARLEAGDLLSFTVSAKVREDLGGILRVGVSARVKSASGRQVTVVLGTRSLSNAHEVEEPIRLSFQQLAQLLPGDFFAGAPARGLAINPNAFANSPAQGLTIEPSAFAIHESGACVAAVETKYQQLACAEINGGSIAADSAAAPAVVPVTGVAGRTVSLRAGVADVGDLLVTGDGQRVFLSNRGGNTLEVLNPVSGSWSSVPVGSRPWGLSFSADGSDVLVANSGGTNVSRVSLAALREEPRIPISRYTLYELKTDSTGAVVLSYYNYADRPQHLAQDAAGRILYSASSTQAAPVGTIRAVERDTRTGQWEARMLFPEGLLVNTPPVENRAVTKADSTWAIANVDSMHLVMAENELGQRYATGEVVFFDHRAGYPNESRGVKFHFTTPAERIAALKFLRGEFGSDIVTYPGYRWNLPTSNRMDDTTFVAASSDHQFVVFGEGMTTATGRAMMWGAQIPALSRVEDIHDLLNNGSDRISGVALNDDGSLGFARGDQGVYFFDRNLRLQGTGGSALVGGRGVAYRSDGAGRERVYVGTGRSSIQVIEPINYRVVTEIPIRSNLTGPLRAGPCATGAPAGCTATLYGITAEGVVVVDVVEP